MTFVLYACRHCGYQTEQRDDVTVEHLCPSAPRGHSRNVQLHPVNQEQTK